jgi:uncharacterized tellurite resistance protein B-like protein
MSDRILSVCDLLLGAAYADKELKEQEKAEVRALVKQLAGDVPAEIEERIKTFDPAQFDLKAAAAPFFADGDDEKRKLLVLVSQINESDDELDLAEDDYLRALAKELDLPSSALDGLAIEVESEELKQTFEQVRKGPPPPPKSRSVDVDI